MRKSLTTRTRRLLQELNTMTGTTSKVLKHSFAALAAAALFTACADRAPVGLEARSASPVLSLTPAELDAASDARFPDLGSCQDLKPPAGSKVTFRVYSTGVQIYHWTGVKWEFDHPEADLFADAGRQGLVGTHFAGPTWKTLSGSQVVGTISKRCTPDANSIAWLLLDAKATGAGVFEQTTHIQRLNTVGGNAPATPGSFIGDEARVPYTADYFFYRAPTE
jgi:hypothetical protein